MRSESWESLPASEGCPRGMPDARGRSRRGRSLRRTVAAWCVALGAAPGSVATAFGDERVVPCGPGAFALLAAAMDVPIDNATLDRMADEDGVTTFSVMAEVARSSGLHAAGFEADVDDLTELEAPAILQVALAPDEPSRLHFIVLLGSLDGDHVLVADPMPGSRLHGKVSLGELDSHWTGVGLAIARADSDLPGRTNSKRAGPGWVTVGVAWVIPPTFAVLAWRPRDRPRVKATGLRESAG